MAQLHDSAGQLRVMFRRPATITTYAIVCATVLATALVTGCGDAPETSAQRDSALDRDLTLAASATPTVSIGDTAVFTPAPEPVAVAPDRAPVSAPRPAPTRTPRPTAAQAPAPTPGPVPPPAASTVAATADAPAATPAPAAADSPAPAGRSRSIGAGTVLSGTTGTAICSLAQRPGDRFVVTLGQPVSSSDGAALPAGTPVLVELARADSATGEFAFRLRGVQANGEFLPAEGTVRVEEASITERKVSKGGSDQGKVVTGAIIGGILGRVLGGGTRGAVIGAAGGAAAGTVAAARNTTTERCLAAGATLSATLSAPLTLPPSP